MFDRYEGGDYAILVHVDLPAEVDREDLSELQLLADSSGVKTMGVMTTSRNSPTPDTLLVAVRQKKLPSR